jgi:hypothetical protein
MTDRQPPEPICIHFNWETWEAKPCAAGVVSTSVTFGPVANMCIVTIPCAGFCDEATCEKRVLKEPKPKNVDPQKMLFE